MAQISLPHHLVNGTVADASQVMANFNAIVNVVNGNLGSDNIGTITGAEITTKDINGGNVTLDNFTQRFQSGIEVLENIPTKTTYSREINFPRSFPGTPYIMFGKSGSQPHNFHISYMSPSRTGFTLYFHSTYATDRERVSIPWLAVYIGSMA
ncbi:hypothetical protein DCC39_10245 [Pueribacillus theae]|uniref:H-type lectin domain-containing protein n=1 Tax=Pueribacillus theae TaxID=2171751 RepID=A0A2U1K1M6_9BACI|nr:hypothetical protein [Pueribacillus theae]PWA11069.1 hypothetical protein DCC39_10245 [Pueribacillus theae]